MPASAINRWRALALALLVVMPACRGPEVREVRTPNGGPGFAISCKHRIDCMELAGKQCPAGYSILDRDSEVAGSSFATANQNSAVAWGKVESTGTLLIECKGDQSDVCGTSRARSRCKKAGGLCIEGDDGVSRCVARAESAPKPVNETGHPNDKGPRCGYTCPPGTSCPYLDWRGCYKPEYDVPEQ
jgi:hypothetical protein